MKKLALYAILAVTLAGVVPDMSTAALARPPYCNDALRRCLDECRTSIQLFTYGCSAGCEIGYLFCGS